MTTRRRVNAARRHWVFTFNNPQKYFKDAEEFQEKVMESCGDRLRYLVFQLEKGNQVCGKLVVKEGTFHYQGITFIKTISLFF